MAPKMEGVVAAHAVESMKDNGRAVRPLMIRAISDMPRRPASMTSFASWSDRSRPQRRRATLLLPRRQGRPYCLLGRSRQAGDDESSGGRVPCRPAAAIECRTEHGAFAISIWLSCDPRPLGPGTRGVLPRFPWPSSQRSAATRTLQRVGVRLALTVAGREARWSRTHEDSSHGVGLPGRLAWSAPALPQREAADPVFSHHADRALLGAVSHELVVLVVKAKG